MMDPTGQRPTSSLAQLTAELNKLPTPKQTLLQRVRGALPALGVIAIVVGFYLLYRYDQQSRQQKEKAARLAEQQQFDDKMSRFSAPYKAVVNWQEPLFGRGLIDTIYTAELTPLLVRADGRPVLVIASLQDITTAEDGSYVIKLESPLNFRSDLQLQLRTSLEHAKFLMAPSSDEDRRYAVIARIISLSSREEVSKDDEEDSKPISVAVGFCLDVLPLGHYTGDFTEMLTRFKMPQPQKQ